MKRIVHLIAAARPNFMKIAPLYHALSNQDWCTVKIIHTGQHYDANMSDDIFADLMLPEPHYHLEVGGGTHASQVGKVMMAYENICLNIERPDFLVVVGDVNSTAACSQVATKLHIPVAHLEAGLRSGDRRMPEEINRLVTDAICDYLWTPSPDADENLIKEGHPQERILRVGNIMMDSYELLSAKIIKENALKKYSLKEKQYGVVTLHRPSNVDTKESLEKLVNSLNGISQKLHLIFAVHPRTKNCLDKFDLFNDLNDNDNITLISPISYVPFMSLVRSAKAVITDSGGIQEETTYLDIPCLTLRENTERPITITQGTNKLVTTENLSENVDMVLTNNWIKGTKPDFWDGQTAHRITEVIKTILKM